MVELTIGSVSVSLITILSVVLGVSVMCCCCFLLAPSYANSNQGREVPWGGKGHPPLKRSASEMEHSDARTRNNSEKEESKEEDAEEWSTV